MDAAYELKWGTFTGHLRETLHKMFMTNHFTDVTLVCDDQAMIQAHKVVLSASSAVFLNMLRQNLHAHPVIYLHGVKYSDMEALLSFMYKGEVRIPEDGLKSFMKASKALQMKEIGHDRTFEKEDGAKTDEDHGVSGDGSPDSAVNMENGVSDTFSGEKEKDPIKQSRADDAGDKNMENSSMDKDVKKILFKSPTSKTIRNRKYKPRKQRDLENVEIETITVKSEEGNFDIQEERYRCLICKKLFTRISRVTEHIKTVHEKESNLKSCHLCDFKTSRGDYLKKHIEAHDDNYYYCDICDYSTKWKATMAKHMKSHNNQTC